MRKFNKFSIFDIFPHFQWEKYQKTAAVLAFLRAVGYDERENGSGFGAGGERFMDERLSADVAEILYEDAALLVCVKPRGVLAAADASGKRSMAALLAPRTVYPVHRLDRETVGVMVFAKTPEAAAALSAALADGFCKEYLAQPETLPTPPEGEMEDLLYHDRIKNKTYVVARKRGGVRPARLSYRVLDGGLVLVRLHTGRTHQIRVQFASRACPLCGDRKYGAKTGGALALWAYRLSFRHPDGRVMTFTLPENFLPPAFFACKSTENAI